MIRIWWANQWVQAETGSPSVNLLTFHSSFDTFSATAVRCSPGIGLPEYPVFLVLADGFSMRPPVCQLRCALKWNAAFSWKSRLFRVTAFTNTTPPQQDVFKAAGCCHGAQTYNSLRCHYRCTSPRWWTSVRWVWHPHGASSQPSTLFSANNDSNNIHACFRPTVQIIIRFFLHFRAKNHDEV